jgi:hypothetical protein
VDRFAVTKNSTRTLWLLSAVPAFFWQLAVDTDYAHLASFSRYKRIRG